MSGALRGYQSYKFLFLMQILSRPIPLFIGCLSFWREQTCSQPFDSPSVFPSGISLATYITVSRDGSIFSFQGTPALLSGTAVLVITTSLPHLMAFILLMLMSPPQLSQDLLPEEGKRQLTPGLYSEVSRISQKTLRLARV